MAFNLKWAVGASVFWPPADRVVSSGYKPAVTEKELYKSIGKVKGIEGVELFYPYDFKDVKTVRKVLNEMGIKVCAVGAGIFSEPKWQYGSVTSYDQKIRKEAMDICRKSIYAAAELGTKIFTFWPAHDGYDYYFQTDYQRKWNLMVESLRELAAINSEINVSIEYKAKEPRTHQLISSAAKVLLISEETEMDNVGAIMDIGHSFICRENPAEEAVYLFYKNRLFHLHQNDNYADWDFDMMPASVHFWENIELFYWLYKLGYNGWINFDICPFREDAVKASELSIKNIKKIISFVKKIDSSIYKKAIDNNDALITQEYIWDLLFKN